MSFNKPLTSQEISMLDDQERLLPIVTQRMLAQTRLLSKTSDDFSPVTDALPMEDFTERASSSSDEDESSPAKEKKARKPQPTVHRQDPYYPERSFVKLREYMTRNHPIDWDKVATKPNPWDPKEKVACTLTTPKRYTTQGILPYVLAVFAQDCQEDWPKWCQEANAQILADPVPKASKGPKKSNKGKEKVSLPILTRATTNPCTNSFGSTFFVFTLGQLSLLLVAVITVTVIVAWSATALSF